MNIPYKIYEELKILNKNLEIVSLLVNAQDQKKLERVLSYLKLILFITLQLINMFHW